VLSTESNVVDERGRRELFPGVGTLKEVDDDECESREGRLRCEEVDEGCREVNVGGFGCDAGVSMSSGWARENSLDVLRTIDLRGFLSSCKGSINSIVSSIGVSSGLVRSSQSSC
jgi:hypothetical protein